MLLFKCLFPSWKFFDQVGPVAKLYYQTEPLTENNWTPCLNTAKRNLFNIFLNPKGNAYLATQGLVDNLVTKLNSIENLDDIVLTTEYKLVVNVVRQITRQTRPQSKSFRFKINVTTPQENYDTLISHGMGL
ncbi:MAG: hypothetical protein KDD37_06325 [Bdellovibrionales bacterium]|nr:hypothetical protein [Bdellovibrionales bacterium]